MGSADCRSYSRNKRGIAGGLIWINFDRHSLLNLFKKAAGKFVADVDEIRPQYQDPSVGSQAVFTSSLVRNVGPSIGSTIDQLDNLTVTEVGGTKELASPWYSDQILPFDITIAGANEYGAMAAAKIFGVEILNEGWGSSIDDAVSEMQVGFGGTRGWARAVFQTWSLPPVSPPASFLKPLPGKVQSECEKPSTELKKTVMRAGQRKDEGHFSHRLKGKQPKRASCYRKCATNAQC